MRFLMGRFGGGAGVGMPVLALTVSTDQLSGYNIATAAGALSVATRIVLTINPAVKIKKITSGTFPANSQLRIINKGVAYGLGGDGGAPGFNGTAGDHAIVITASSGLTSIEIENGAGYILGAGGGGKGDGSIGGGGGAGGGLGGVAGGFFVDGKAGKVPKWTGAAWDNIATDAGGSKGTGTGAANNGTTWGTTGLSGDGAPGKAIELNGGVSPTWLSGNDSTHLKGAVS